MRILIVDDEPLARQRLAQLLAQCAPASEVDQAADGEQAWAMIQAKCPDLLLLDVNLPGQQGTALAARLTPQQRPLVAFSTAYEQHAVKAFELEAVDYLLKPVRLQRLQECLARVQQRLQQLDQRSGESGYLHGRERGQPVRIALAEVSCLIAEEKYVLVHHQRGQLLLDESLRQLEESHPQLLRLHRNCLVPRQRLVGLQPSADGRVLARLAGSALTPEVSRRALPLVRRLLRG